MYSLRSLLLRTGDKEAARGIQTANAYYPTQDTTHRTFLTKDIDKFSGAVVIGLILIMFIVGTHTNYQNSPHSAYASSSDSTEQKNDTQSRQYQKQISVALSQVIAQKNRQHILARIPVAGSQDTTPQFLLHSIQGNTVVQPSIMPITTVLSEVSTASVKEEVKKIEVANKPVSVQPATDPDSGPAAFIPDNKQYIVKEKMVVPMTAYSSTVDQTDSTPFITASNKRVRWGIVAANFLPFGTKVRIPSMYGDMVFTVEDRMNKRYWHRVDIWMYTRQEALQFGIRNLEIEILQEA